jgi:hypothetical protein
MQTTRACLGEVTPALVKVRQEWMHMDLEGSYKLLRDCLVTAFDIKIASEINSGIYNAAALLHTAYLYNWYQYEEYGHILKSAKEEMV